MRHAVLDAVAGQRRTQQIVEIVLRHCIGVLVRRADYEDELATGFHLIRSLRQLRDRRAFDLLVQFGQFTADRGVAAGHHLVEALELGDALDAFVTYDKRLAEAATMLGLPVVAPS